ncbi:MAG: TonB-dependent receptor [Deltaproteobacteria bacterium]|nr:TonB-dependent receptor [Deltaproteobacteria bacterium]
MKNIFKMVMVLFVLTLFSVMPAAGLAEEYKAKETEETAADGDKKEKKKAEEVKLEEVVVTATRTPQKVMDAPSNIMVITSKEIEAMDAKTSADVLKKLPGVYFSDSSGNLPHLSLRGTRIGMSSGALVLVNGIPMSLGEFGYTDWDYIQVENIERIEIVKGPLSSLYGGDAARGVISITTKRQPEKKGGKVGAIVGEYGDRRVYALVNGGIKKFDYNLNFKKKDSDGYREDAGIDNVYFTGDFGYWLSDDTRISWLLNVADIEKYFAKQLTKEEKEEDRRQTLDRSFTDTTDIITGLNLELNKEFFDWQVNLYYKNRDKEYENYLKATKTPYKKDVVEDVWGIKSIATCKESVFNLKNSLSFGFDFDWDDSDIVKKEAEEKEIGVPYTEDMPKSSGNFIKKSFGVFLQDELSVLSNLTLTAGLRYDYFAYDNNADYDFSEGGTFDYDETPNFDRFNPRIGINYRVFEELSFYGSYSNAYRSPTIYDFYGTGTHAAEGGYSLKPEKFTQYEMGLRYKLKKWIGFEVAVYRIEIEDMLDTYYDEEGNYAGKRNVGKALMKGVETSLFGSFFDDRINCTIRHSYIDARYGDDCFAKNPDKAIVSIDGNRIAKLPYNIFNFDLDVKLLQNENYDLMWHFGIMTRDEYQMDKLNSMQSSGYTLAETKLTLNCKSFEVFVAANNLFDKEYDRYAYVSKGTDYYYPAEGITWSGGLSFEF